MTEAKQPRPPRARRAPGSAKPAGAKAAAARPRGAGGRFLPAAAAVAAATAPEKGKRKNEQKPKRDARSGSKPPEAASGLTLLFIRHADAGDSAAWQGDDAVRPLSKKGRRDSKRLGDLLDELGVRPDAILTSPRVRAADTAKLVGRRVGTKVAVDERLDAGFNAERLGAIVADLPPGASLVAVVGHDPDFSVLTSWLTNAPLAMAKGAVARIDVPGRAIGSGRGTLRWLIPPDALPH
jgi:phosphohistidine phosphatase SixA